MRKKLSKEEINKRFEEATQVFKEIANNKQTPKNIRKAAEEIISILNDEKLSPAAKVANVISVIEGMAYDPNTPIFVRMKVWKVVSMLEPIRD